MDTVYQGRIEKLRLSAEKENLKALDIFSKGSRNLSQTSTHGNLRFLMDWTSWGSPSMFLLPMEGAPVLIVPIPGDVEQAHETIPWLSDIRFRATADYGKIAQGLLSEKKINGRVGTLGFHETTHGIYSYSMKYSSNWTIEEADLLLDRQRMVKDDIVLTKMRRAAKTWDLMLEALAQVLKEPGIPAWKAQVEMENAGRLDGAEVVWSWFVTGPHPDHPRVRREENARRIQRGDCVVAGIIMIYEGYYGHTLRMLTIGEPSAQHKLLWKAVSEAQEAAVTLLKPGVGISAPNIAAEQILFRYFPDARTTDKIRFRPCHFIGLDYAEYPTSQINANLTFSNDATEMVLQKRMTMEVHPNIRPPELGFGAVGDIFVVTHDGGERLTTFPHEIVVVEPG